MTVTCFVLPSLTDGVVLRMSAQSNTQAKGMTMHEITSTDNMFSVREMPWHGLGKVLSEYTTREEAKSIAHPWELVTGPLFRQVPGFGTAGMPTGTDEHNEGTQAGERGGNGASKGGKEDTHERQ